MDRWRKPDQDRRIGDPRNEERDDRGKRTETDRHPKEGSIEDIDDRIVSLMLMGGVGGFCHLRGRDSIVRAGGYYSLSSLIRSERRCR